MADGRIISVEQFKELMRELKRIALFQGRKSARDDAQDKEIAELKRRLDRLEKPSE